MTRYHCPYCSPSPPFHKEGANGVFVCGYCGDPLVKLPLIKPTQVLAIILTSAFAAPLILAITSFIYNSNELEDQGRDSSMAEQVIQEDKLSVI